MTQRLALVGIIAAAGSCAAVGTDETIALLAVISGVVMAVVTIAVLISRKIDKVDHHREMDQCFHVLKDHVAADDRRIGAIEDRMVRVDEKLGAIQTDMGTLLALQRRTSTPRE